MVLSPMLLALLKDNVVNEAANPCILSKQAFLLGRGVQFVTVATLDHSQKIPFVLTGNNMDYR